MLSLLTPLMHLLGWELNSRWHLREQAANNIAAAQFVCRVQQEWGHSSYSQALTLVTSSIKISHVYTHPTKCTRLWVGGRDDLTATLGVCSTCIQSSLKEQPPKRHHNPFVLPSLCCELSSFNQPLITERSLALTAGHNLANCMHILESFFLGSTINQCKKKLYKKSGGVGYDHITAKTWRAFKVGIMSRKFRRITHALFGLSACSHMLRVLERFCCQLLLFISSHNLWWCSWGSAAEESGFTRDTQLPLLWGSSRTWLCPHVHGMVGEGSGMQFRWHILEV